MNKSIIESIDKLLHNKSIDDNSRLMEIQRVITEQQTTKIKVDDSKLLKDIFKHNLEIIKNNTQLDNQISSGYENLDHLIYGFGLGEFIVFGGRPAMGKTTLFLNLALRISINNPVLFFSFDLSESALNSKVISNLTSITKDKIKKNQFDKMDLLQLEQAEEKINHYELYINESCSNSIIDFRLHCEKMINEKGIKVVFIDYIQLMSASKFGNRRELEISYISRELKRIAKELKISVIASSQLSRAVEMRGGDKRPILSDLRESGALEQDADKVIFIYRPEYYGFHQDEDGNSNVNRMQLIVEKNRTGALGIVDLECNLATSFITDYCDDNSTINNIDGFKFSDERLDELNNDPF
jgi:replicative DNA helicase